MGEVNPYRVLGVSPRDSQEVIKAAYKRLSKLYHPDVIGTGDGVKFREINEAYTILKNHVSEKVVDSSVWVFTSLFSIKRRRNEK